MRNALAKQPVMTLSSLIAIESDTLFQGEVTHEAVLALSPRLDRCRQQVRAWRTGEPHSFFYLPFREDIGAIRELGAHIAQRFAATIVFGIGGSSLGGETLIRCLGGKKHPVRFFDNIDPVTLASLSEMDWKTTDLIVISKSGQTAETLAQFLSMLPILEAKHGTRLKEYVRIITEDPDGALARIGEELGLDVLAHPAVGGRFSALSIVGLLPAAIGGVDIDALLYGARLMAEQCMHDDMNSNPAFVQGAAQYLHSQQGRQISVFMPYADRLRPLGLWYRQLWAESLGKHDPAGRAHGLTPALAMGVTDQHSQLQLYLDGPDNKQFTLLADPAVQTQGARIGDRFAHLPAVQPLNGHTVGELLWAEFRATRETLTRHQRPNRVVNLDTRDPAALGAFMFQLEMETVVVAELLGVDPFDQPAVEEGKRLAREYLKK